MVGASVHSMATGVHVFNHLWVDAISGQFWLATPEFADNASRCVQISSIDEANMNAKPYRNPPGF